MIIHGDCRDVLPKLPHKFAQCCVTSPPYFQQRDYSVIGQIGIEDTPTEYIHNLVGVFRQIGRILRDDGTLWIVIGDTYSAGGRGGGGKQDTNRGSLNLQPLHLAGPHKNLLGIPWRLAFGLQDDGWILRRDVIWSKPTPMPEGARDRPTAAHEYVFLFTKQPRYYYDWEAIATVSEYPEGRRPNRDRKRYPNGFINGIRNGGVYPLANRRDVWSIMPEPFKGNHFAVMPTELAGLCILAGTRRGDLVIDPFGGVGTTAMAATKSGRRSLIIELNADYVRMAGERLDTI